VTRAEREHVALCALVTADPLRLQMAAWYGARLEAEEHREQERQERIRREHPTFWREGAA
jgi:hypothetical protein